MRCRVLSLIVVAACLSGCGRSPAGGGFESLDTPAAAGSAEPHLARGADGTIVLSWLEPDSTGVALRHSNLVGDAWQPARTVARGDDWFVNWADFPSVVPIDEDLWAAHWLVRQPAGGYAYDIAIKLSFDRGQSWSEAITPHTDGTPAEHGFVSLFPSQNAVGAIWLDGRNRAGTELRTATIGRDASLRESDVVDAFVCDCCQTDVAMSAHGPLVVYRDRTPGEVRDIYVARAVDGVWQSGRPVADDGWSIAGCPVNGPAIAAAGNQVAVAWFTGAGDSPRVRLARSNDGAATFAPALDVDAAGAMGRVDVEIASDGDTVVSWVRSAGDEAELVLRRVAKSGASGPVVPIARTGADRPSGFPQLVRAGDALVLAWTDTSAQPSQVRSARIDWPSLDE